MKLTQSRPSSGSILIYVLMAIVLLGGLTFMMTRQMSDGGVTGTVTASKAKLKGEELITYATAAKSAVEQMRTMMNVLPNEFSFVKQSDTVAYAAAPHKGKIYHPVGGGLNEFVAAPEMFKDGSAGRGWVGQVGTNVEWSQTTGSDVIFSFLDVNEQVCKAINERMTKTSTIPTTTIDTAKVFINGGSDDADFLIANCSDCNGKTAQCVKDKDGVNVFYNILISR